MQVKTEKVSSVDVKVFIEADSKTLEQKIEKIAKDAGKNMKVDGFRKGKVPTHIVKARYGDQLKEDARSEILREALEQAKSELSIDDTKILGEPRVVDFKEEGEGFSAEVRLELRPEIEFGEYNSFVPEFEVEPVSDEEVEERLKQIAQSTVIPAKIEEDRGLQEGDFALFDFEGFVDGEAFEGGKAEGFTLEIGSKNFIEGFEEKMIGLKAGHEGDIEVKFPEEYGKEELAGKDAVFKIKIQEIQEKPQPTIDEEFAKKVLPNEESPTVELVKEKIKEQIEREKLGKLYNEELKPKLIDALIENINFDLPELIVDQEINMKINQELQALNQEEAQKIIADENEVEKLKQKHKEDAEKSVKATFIMDELAKVEGVSVDDNEVLQTIYYEAMQMGQDPQKMMEYYQQNNVLPAIKMGMIEDKLLNKLLDRKAGREV
ncbi:MAG: trigger factor [Campylobacterales bacterium]